MSFTDYLNTICDISTLTKTVNTKTGQMVESYTAKYSNVPCRLNPISGNEYPASATYLSNATHKLFMEYTGYTVNVTDRITIDSINYDVLFVANAAGHNDHYEIIVELIK